MFDNPRKELQRLEDQLLAAEEGEWSGQWEQEPRQERPAQPPEEETEDAEPLAQKSSRTPMLAALLLIEVGVLFAALAWWMLWR